MFLKVLTFAVTGLMASLPVAAEDARRYDAQGLVVKVDRAGKTVVISHDAIPGYMDAMAMPFQTRGRELPEGLKAGAKIKFSLFIGSESSWIDDIVIVPFDSPATDPVEVRRFRALEKAMGVRTAKALSEGDPVPGFSLVDQTGETVKLGDFAGRVVAINFVYTRCPLPDFCFRLSNNFGRLKKRFEDRLGRDLILLTVSFDPVRDQPEVLARYAQIWKADPRTWHFLTGPLSEVQRVCALFGVGVWADEGAMTHSLHTAIIGRDGRLVANIEGNQFTSEQLGDLVESTLAARR